MKRFTQNSLPGFAQTMVFLIVILCVSLAWASAGVGGSIQGTVKDSTGAVIAGACVVATDVSTGSRHSVTANDRGSYAFAMLPVGHYDIAVPASSRTGAAMSRSTPTEPLQSM
jgi:hypothetical protein